jgi:hypothetical protein
MRQQLDPKRLIGTWRRFGEVGPAYEVIGIGEELSEGDWAVKIRMAETGEEVDYTLKRLAEDEILADRSH